MKKYLIDLLAGAAAGVVCFFLGLVAGMFSNDVRVYLLISGILIVLSTFVYTRVRSQATMAALRFAIAAIFFYLAIFSVVFSLALFHWQPFL